LEGHFRTHRPPYPTSRVLVTTWQETKKFSQGEIWMDNVREDLKEIKVEDYHYWEATKNKKEVWRSLVRASSLAMPMEERQEEEEDEIRTHDHKL